MRGFSMEGKMINRIAVAIKTSCARVVLMLAFAAAMFAHSGFDHVRGTVVSAKDNVLTVKTATGNVAVKLDSHTALTRDNRKAQLSDLTPGTRVIVEVPHAGKDKVAESIKLGPAAPASRK